jgi:putative glutamine amidotransferase
VVGITSYVEPASWAVWHDERAVVLPWAYVEAVTAGGGRAVVLPPDDVDSDVLGMLDALVLAGGADLDSDLYGEPRAPLTDPRPDRDAGEITLLRAALDADLPVLGVCRGMQLLAAACGGRLHQHLPDVVHHDRHRPAPGVYGTHPVRFAAGSRIAALVGTDIEVNSYHHQGVADPGSLRVTGWADDHVVEAVEDDNRRFVLGVQWHPEAARDARLFAALVAAARHG